MIMKIAIITSAAVLASGIAVSTLSADSSSLKRADVEFSRSAALNTEAAAESSETFSKATAAPVVEVPQTEIKELEITDKDTCYHKLLNSIDYYDYASGKIETNMLNGNDFSIGYNVDMRTGSAYQHVLSSDFDEEVFAENGTVTTVNNLLKTDNITSFPATSKTDDTGNYDDDSSRISCDNGIMSYRYRQNPTNLHYASTFSIFPQEMTFGFLSNKELWSISGKENYLGRETVIVEGTTSPEYGAKLNISNFRMNIDSQTGVLLKFEGYDASGSLTNYMRTTEFSDAQ